MISLRSNRPCSNTADRGFTLLELMVSVSIAAILTVMALPAFHAFVLNDRDIAQINSLVASFNYARSEAVKQNLSTGIIVCPSGDGSSCNGTTAWSDGWIVWNTNAAVPKAQMVLQAVPALAGSNTLDGNGRGRRRHYFPIHRHGRWTAHHRGLRPARRGLRARC